MKMIEVEGEKNDGYSMNTEIDLAVSKGRKDGSRRETRISNRKWQMGQCFGP